MPWSESEIDNDKFSVEAEDRAQIDAAIAKHAQESAVPDVDLSGSGDDEDATVAAPAPAAPAAAASSSAAAAVARDGPQKSRSGRIYKRAVPFGEQDAPRKPTRGPICAAGIETLKNGSECLNVTPGVRV